MTRIDPATTTVASPVAWRPERSQVFERFGIDDCCRGKVSLESACATRRLDVKTVALTADYTPFPRALALEGAARAV